MVILPRNGLRYHNNHYHLIVQARGRGDYKSDIARAGMYYNNNYINYSNNRVNLLLTVLQLLAVDMKIIIINIYYKYSTV